MVTVHFLPANRSITVASGTTILEAARLAGILIESPCNGAVVCGKCTVHLDPDSLHKVVRKGIHHLTRREERTGQVLSCEAEVVGDITVSVPALTASVETVGAPAVVAEANGPCPVLSRHDASGRRWHLIEIKSHFSLPLRRQTRDGGRRLYSRAAAPAGSRRWHSAHRPTSWWWCPSSRNPCRAAISRCRISNASNSNSTTLPHL